jgi:hypothetical protein
MKHQQTVRTRKRITSLITGAKKCTGDISVTCVLLLRSAIILAIYTLLTLILTYPLIFNLMTTVPNDIGDPLLNTWILAWDSHALLTDPFNLFNANIFHPLPNTLAYSEHLFSTALVALPLQLISGEPILAYNLSLLATFPLAALGMYLLALRWTGHRSAAFIAGLIFAFNPYRFAAIAHLQLLTFQWLPFALLLLDKIVTSQGVDETARHSRFNFCSKGIVKSPFWPGRQPKVARNPGRANLDLLNQQSVASHLPPTWPEPPGPGLETGHSRRAPMPLYLALSLFLLLQILASWYLALYTILTLGLYLLAAHLTHRFHPSRLIVLISISLISIFLTLLFVLPYISIINDLREARPLSLALSLAAVPTDFVAAAPFNCFFGPLTEPFRSHPAFTEENMLFVGIVAPALALVSLFTFLKFDLLRIVHRAIRTPHHVSRFTFHVLLIILVFSVILTFSTPYAILAAIFPPSTIIRVPARWIIPALFALSGLAAFGYANLKSQISISKFKSLIPNFLFLICTTLLILESLSIPLPLAPVENRDTLNPVYHWLADQPDDFALVELPLHSAPAPEYPEVKRLYASTMGWWQLVNGYSGYTPPRQPQLAQSLASFPDEGSVITLQTLAIPSDSSFLIPHSSLYLLVHPDEAPMDRSRWETTGRWQAERNPALYPLGQFEGDYLYQVSPPDPQRFTAPSLATFGPDQTIHLLAVDMELPSMTKHHASPITPHASRITLYWQSTTLLPTNYTVFIHLRAPDGFVRSQADGPPVSGHYPTTEWQPGEIIQDVHPLPAGDLSQVKHLAIGLYNPVTGERLPAFGPEGERLAEDAVVVRGKMEEEKGE